MNRKRIVAIVAAVLVAAIGASYAMAAESPATREAKRDAFVGMLNDEQKAAYEELHPEPTERPERPEPDEAAKAEMEAEMAEMKERYESFVAGLSEAQKTELEAIMSARHGGRGGMGKGPGGRDFKPATPPTTSG